MGEYGRVEGVEEEYGEAEREHVVTCWPRFRGNHISIYLTTSSTAPTPPYTSTPHLPGNWSGDKLIPNRSLGYV